MTRRSFGAPIRQRIVREMRRPVEAAPDHTRILFSGVPHVRCLLELRRWTLLWALTILIWALAAISSAVAQESEPATRQFAVAAGFQKQMLYDSAIEEWQIFVKKFPDDPRLDRAMHYLGTCQLQAKQYAAAAATLDSVVRKYPKSELLDQTLLNLGSAWYSQGQQSGKPEDYQQAQAFFSRVSKEFPKSEFAGRALYYLGESFYQQKKFTEAADSYSRLIQEFPKEEFLPDALYALGTCQESMKQTDAAVATFADFRARFPEHHLATEVAMREAELLFTAGKFTEARGRFASVSSVKEFPLADTAMLRQARCLYELGNYDEAGTVYWNLPRQFPKTKYYDTAVLSGSKCYYLVGKYELARSGLEIVSRRNVPEAAEATQWIARSLLKEKNPAAALKILEDAIGRFRKSPEFPQLILARIDALADLPDRKAESVALYADFARTYSQDPLASQSLYMAALTALDLGQHDAARAYSEDFLKQFSNDQLVPDVRFIGAEARLLLGDYQQAAALYRDFLRAAPSHTSAPQAQVRLGLALQLAKQYPEALTILDTAVKQLTDPALKSEALAIRGRCFFAEEQYQQAAEAFEESLKDGSGAEQSAQTLLSLADVYRRLNRPQDATARLERLRKEFPSSPLLEEATFRQAEAAYAQGDFSQAAQDYAVVVSKWPKGAFAPHAQYGISWCSFKQNDFAKAVAAVALLSTQYPNSELAAKGLYVKAMAEYQLGQLDDAVRDVRAFLTGKPGGRESLDAQYLLGLTLAGQKKFAEAAQTYSAILKSDARYPDADKVLYELAWAQLEDGKESESGASFRRLAGDFPESPLAAESLFRVAETHYDAAEYTEAARAYEQAQTKAGSGELGEKAAHKLAWSYFKSNLPADAAAAFQTQLKAYPAGALAGDAEFLLGECLFQQQQWQPALAQYSKVIASHHPNWEALALYRSGECTGALEQWDASLQFNERVLKQFPEFDLRPEARYAAGWALQQQDKISEAILYYEKVTEETDTETAAKARFMVGECYFATKNHKEASKHFLKAAFAYGHKEWSAMSYFEAARCFEVLRDVAQAKNCYQQMLDKYPDHSKAAEARKRLAEL